MGNAGMSFVEVVTTMNGFGWQETGARMVHSFLERWPSDARLTLYAEDFEPARTIGLNVRKLPEWHIEFKRRHKGNSWAHGQTVTRYDFRQDAVKFSHKVAALTDAGLQNDNGILIWLDADTFTHAPVTHEWLKGLFPEPSYVAWLDRHNCYPECGFIMFRCGHKAHQKAMQDYQDLYVTDRVFKLPETHDSFVFQRLIEGMVTAGDIEPPVSLSGDKGWSHPFVNGPLGACMDHMKGDRKKKGRSSRWDTRQPRSEPYWKMA
jgi:hypothetical protein